MKRIYINTNIDENKIAKYFLLSLTPLIMFGLYKNVILNIDNGNWIKPLLCLFIPYLTITIYSYIKNKKIKYRLEDYYLLASVLFIPFSLNITIYLIFFFICFILSTTKIKISPALLLMTLISIYTLIANPNYSSFYQISKDFNYTIFDYILGMGNGGLYSSSIIFGIITFYILSLNKYYKKYIPIYFTVSYLIIANIYNLVFDFNFEFVTTTILAVVILGTYSKKTPCSQKKIMIYSIILSLSCVIPNRYEYIYIMIFIYSLLINKYHQLTI